MSPLIFHHKWQNQISYHHYVTPHISIVLSDMIKYHQTSHFSSSNGMDPLHKHQWRYFYQFGCYFWWKESLVSACLHFLSRTQPKNTALQKSGWRDIHLPPMSFYTVSCHEQLTRVVMGAITNGIVRSVQWQ